MFLKSTSLLLLFMGILASACERRPQAPVQPEGLAIAQLGQRVILDRDLMSVISLVEEKTPLKIATHPQKKELLDQFINVELLYEEALKRNIQEKYEFRSKLVDVYIEELSRQARDALTDREIEKVYLKNPRAFDQVAARHIFFSLPDGRNTPEKTREEKYRRAQQLYEELKASPDEFGTYARRHSEDRTARQGGELGYFTYAQMEKSLAEAAFSLKKAGDLSPVIRSDFGYHIVQLTGDKRGFEHHKEVIRVQLVRQRQKEILDQEISRLRKSREIKIFEDNLATLSPLPQVIKEDPLDLMKRSKPE